MDKTDKKIDNLAANGFVAAQPSKETAKVELEDEILDLIDSHEKFEELENKLKSDSAYRANLVSAKSFHAFVFVYINVHMTI